MKWNNWKQNNQNVNYCILLHFAFTPSSPAYEHNTVKKNTEWRYKCIWILEYIQLHHFHFHHSQPPQTCAEMTREQKILTFLCILCTMVWYRSKGLAIPESCHSRMKFIRADLNVFWKLSCKDMFFTMCCVPLQFVFGTHCLWHRHGLIN